MIYSTKERAIEVAAELNQRRGYAQSYACRTAEGWTVICSTAGAPMGRFGVVEVA